MRTREHAVDAGPDPGGVLLLQRSAGNAAVARALDRNVSSRAIVQRDEKSAALLKKLATPKVGLGQATDVQTKLVDELEDLVGERKWSHGAPTELNIGGVLIDRLPSADKSYSTTAKDEQRKQDIHALYGQLVDRGEEGSGTPAAQYVGLDTKAKGARSTGVAFGAEVKKAGLGSKVVENTLKTMLDADQFEYLRLAGLPNDDWKILVELHYIRARPKDMAGFHKDTKGQSLFVNLNYHVPGHRVRGPEYVLNPPRSEAHDKQIYGSDGAKGTLPEQFTGDLTTTRRELPEPTKIESAGTVEELGYVAFVDEAVHHATPWFENRYVTPTEFKAYLERKHKAQLDEIVRADTKYRGSLWPERIYKFPDYVNKDIIGAGEIDKWRTWLAMISGESEASKRRRDKRYTRLDFVATMKDGEFDLMLEDVGSQPGAARERAGAGGWFSASIPDAGLSGVRPKDKPPLVRTASSADLTKDWPKQLPEDVPRRFIRSWVRAVPKSLADEVRGS